ncbi:MAG TPA: 16S rRNA (guanine(527)-N(7))-methyltransferase RsmG [Thermodesulfobacteriota bacterium]|nr:16S rRNA (guanine(527)-N(7))-methyltransferase RsmG [Thermodesulfobacteriota bacterium]
MKEKELKDILRQGALELGVELDEGAIEKFRVYLRELTTWNKKINLTSIADEREIVIRHFLDSLTPWRILKDSGCRTLLDIGSGAGFPGIPLKIAEPGLEVVLMDAVEKKVNFTRHVIRTLALSGIRAEKARVEDPGFIRKYGGHFDCVISRAFSGLKKFIHIAEPLCREGGLIVAIKGPGAADELKELKKAPEIREIRLPFSDRTTVILSFKKTGENFL